MPAKTPFGEYISDGNAYCVTTPFPPMRLTNMLFGEDGYSAEVSHFGVSRSSIMLDRPYCVTANDGKLLYCRDDESMVVWSPGVLPMMSRVEKFRCEHHEGYTLITSLRDGIRITWLIFVPRYGQREMWTVVVDNETDRARRISIVPVVFPAETQVEGMAPLTERMMTQCRWESSIGGILCSAGFSQNRERQLNLLLGSALRPEQTWCSARGFFGAALAPQYPRSLFDKTRGSERGAGELPFMALRCQMHVAPHGTERTDFTVAVVDTVEHAKQQIDNVQSVETVDRLFEDVHGLLRKRWDRVRINTPDADLNAFVNTWCKKGCGCVGTVAVSTRERLLCSSVLSMVDVEVMQREVLAALARQNPDGSVFDRSGDRAAEADGPVWLALGICDYIKASNNIAFLDAPVPYANGIEEPVRLHLEKAIAVLANNSGPHGLPLIRGLGARDQILINDPQGECVVLAMLLGCIYREMRDLFAFLHNPEKSALFADKHGQLKQLVNRVAWDETGEYYIRAFKRSTPLGGSQSEGARIFSEPQCWALLGDMVPAERITPVVQALDMALGTEFGTVVATPPYKTYDPGVGPVSSMVPGCGQNGAVLSSLSGLKACSDAFTGRGSHAYAALVRMMPSLSYDPVADSGVQPHVLPVGFSMNPEARGRAFGSWMTTGYAWALKTVVEGIMGIRAAYGGIEFVPALPEGWGRAEIVFERQNAVYQVTVVSPPRFGTTLQPACQGNRNVRLPNNEFAESLARSGQKVVLRVNGAAHEGRFLSFLPAGRHTIEVNVNHG